MRSLRSIFLFFSLVFSCCLYSQKVYNRIFTGCAATEMLIGNSNLFSRQSQLDLVAYDYFTSGRTHRTTNTIALIPTVIHIIHNGGPENISNAQAQAAISNINAKLLANNNYQVQLCLAQRDPFNNPTIGITRDSSILTNETMEIDDSNLKSINCWSPTCYLNIWIVNSINSQSMGPGVIGYSTFPASHGQSTDGIVIEANYFGTNPVNDCVGTHELGHYLGLYHTFQNACINNNCLLDGDQVCDTPPDQTTFGICAPPANSCNTDSNDPSTNNPFQTDVPDLSDDYMDYSSLTCYTQFTSGQYDRMQFFLTNVRSSLLSCLSCSSPCPAPVAATITSPGSLSTVSTGASVNFTGTMSNSTSSQWYINAGNVLGTGLSLSYTFNTAGIYWMKFRAISSNTASCLDGLDSVQIKVIQPATAACVGSLQFMNSNDAVLLPSPPGNQYYNNANGFTWECWVKLTTPFSSYNNALLRPMICVIDPISYEDICLSFGWAGGVGNVPITSLAFKVDGPGFGGANPVSCSYFPTGGFTLGTWYHVAATMDYVNHVAKLYLNGSLVDTKTNNEVPMTRQIPAQLSWDVILNQGFPNPPLGGNMDEVRIWSKVRTPTEIATYYNQCLSGNESNLMLYYRCNQTAGSLATDASPNANDGTLTHTASWSTQQPILSGSNCSIGCAGSCPPIDAGSDTAICSGHSVQLNATSGFLSYTWTPSATLNNPSTYNPIATPTISTIYIVTGTSVDTNMQSCTSVDSIRVSIINPVVPVLNLGPDINLCMSGTHTFNAGAGFTSYHWNDGTNNQTYTAYLPGKYWVTVTDSCGGIQADTVIINLVPSPALNLRPDTTICKNESVMLNFTPTGLFTSFSWSPSSSLNCTVCQNPIATPSVSTQYFLLASSPEGCIVEDSVKINVIQNVPYDLTLSIHDATCSKPNGAVQVDSVSGGTSPYQYELNGSSFSNSTIFQNLAAGNYTVTVSDSADCKYSEQTIVNDHPGPSAITIITSNSSMCEANGSVQIQYVSGGTAPYLFSLNNSNFNTAMYFTGLSAGQYTVAVVDSNQCLYTTTTTIQLVTEEEEIKIPNCFTPNDDAINDSWFISGNCIRSIQCIIYNRWGTELKRFSEISERWDGNFDGKKISDGVYFYTADILFESGKSIRSSGWIQLIR